MSIGGKLGLLRSWRSESTLFYSLKIGAKKGLQVRLPFDGIAFFYPGGVACEKCPHICVACLFCRDRGLEAGRSTVSAAIKYQRGVFIGGQERGDHREILLRDVRRARYMTGRIFQLRPVIDNNELFFLFDDRFKLFHIYVLDCTGKETTCRDNAKHYDAMKTGSSRVILMFDRLDGCSFQLTS